jgi:hypothetical protein
VKYRRYTTDDHPGRDPIAQNPVALATWKVTCVPIKGTPGNLIVYVRAKDAATAADATRKGRVPGIGLGWHVMSTVEVDTSAAPNAPRVY